MPKSFSWTVKFTVDPVWVADGFDLDNERALEMLAAALPYAQGSELRAQVIAAPPAHAIRKEQGYSEQPHNLRQPQGGGDR